MRANRKAKRNNLAPTQNASPFSTGGGGDVYQSNVGAYYLSVLLTQGRARGLEFADVEEVQFQRHHEDNPLDDIIVIGRHAGGLCKLTLQVKHRFSITERDPVFERTLKDCYDTFSKLEFQRETDRCGFVLGIWTSALDAHYQAVLSWAKQHATSNSFFKLIRSTRTCSQEKRAFVSLIRKKVNKFRGASKGVITDDELWLFLRSLVFLHFDFGIVGSRDYAYAVDLVRYVTPSSNNNAQSLFSKLYEYASVFATGAGNFSIQSLFQKLKLDNVPLSKPYGAESDYLQLKELASSALQDIKDTIGGIKLDRGNILGELQAARAQRHFIKIVGDPGSGKSSVLKHIAEECIDNGSGIFLAAKRIPTQDWQMFAATQGIKNSLNVILSALGTSGEPTLLIDSVDRIDSITAQNFVNDLVRRFSDVWTGINVPWSIVVSQRNEATTDSISWLDTSSLRAPYSISIPDLSESEFDKLAEQLTGFKSLKPVFQTNRVVRNPKMLQLVFDSGMSEEIQHGGTISEVDLLTIWKDKIIGTQGPGGIDRKDTILRAGHDLVTSESSTFERNSSASTTIHSLIMDNVISTHNDCQYQFTHDIYEEWCLCLKLKTQLPNLSTYLSNIKKPFRLWRPIQLLSQQVLESEHNSWDLGLQQLTDTGILSLVQAYLIGFLHSTRADELMEKIGTVLLIDKGTRLQQLLVLLRTVELDTLDADIGIPVVVPRQAHQLMSSVLGKTKPRIRVWAPAFRWLVKNVKALPDEVIPELARIFAIWQEKTDPHTELRAEIAAIAFDWLEESRQWK